jgi:hypothetical protein
MSRYSPCASIEPRFALNRHQSPLISTGAPAPQPRHLWQNMRRMLKSPFIRNRSTWMWVAIAAVAFTSVARAEAGLQNSKGYSHPVLEFLVRSQGQNPAAHSAVMRFASLGSGRHANCVLRRGGSGALIAMLPVFFVGLVSPLTPLSVASIRSLGRVPAGPQLSALFQRPPPSLA